MKIVHLLRFCQKIILPTFLCSVLNMLRALKIMYILVTYKVGPSKYCLSKLNKNQ